MTTAIAIAKRDFSQLLVEAKLKNYPTIKLADGREMTVDANGLLHRGRTSLLPPPDPVEIRLAESWLGTVTAIRSRGTAGGAGSYRLKHVAEEEIGHYLCNGALIVALDRTGWMQSTDYRSLNTFTNLPARLLDRIADEQRKKRYGSNED